MDTKTKQVREVVRSEVPDLILVTGTLKESSIAQEGATLSFRLRRGQPFLGEVPFIWSINGEKGELRISSPGGPSLQPTADGKGVSIEIHDHETDKVSQIEWDWADWLKDLVVTGRDTATLYENFANGGHYPTLEDSLKLHEQIAEIMADWNPPTAV
nr:hypothetical protein CFP56_24306 [Quercus suber]